MSFIKNVLLQLDHHCVAAIMACTMNRFETYNYREDWYSWKYWLSPFWSKCTVVYIYWKGSSSFQMTCLYIVDATDKSASLCNLTIEYHCTRSRGQGIQLKTDAVLCRQGKGILYSYYVPYRWHFDSDWLLLHMSSSAWLTSQHVIVLILQELWTTPCRNQLR